MQERFSIDALRYVRAVMDESSFSGAARALQVSQPALSAAVARLEDQLGQRLFHRSPRGVVVTEFGEEIRPSVDMVLDTVEGLFAKARKWEDARRGRIHMGVSPLIDSSLVAGIHHGLRARAPEHCGIVLSEGNLDTLAAGLRTGDFDAVLVPSVRPLPGFQHRIVGSEPMVVVEQSPAGTDPVELSDLADRRFILVPDSCGLTTFTRDLFAEQGLPLAEYPGEAASYRVLEEWRSWGLVSRCSLDPNSEDRIRRTVLCRRGGRRPRFSTRWCGNRRRRCRRLSGWLPTPYCFPHLQVGCRSVDETAFLDSAEHSTVTVTV